MKKALSLFVLATACLTAGAQQAELLKDINPGPGSSYINYMTQLGDKVIFQTTVIGSDNGPWVTDGTSEGTYMLKKLDSYSGPMVVFKNEVYFSGDDGTTGLELWKTDGTSEGTVIVKDIFPGSYGSRPGELTVFNDALYFSGTHPDYGEELCVLHVTDGQSVISIYDITEGTASTKPGWLYPASGKLYFVGRDDRFLYYHDPLTGTTTRYTDVVKPGPADDPYFADYNCSVYFRASKAKPEPVNDFGVQLWKVLTDGYVLRLSESFSNNVDLDPAFLTKVGDKLFFAGDVFPFGVELCFYAGEEYDKPGVTYMARDINPEGHSGLTDAFFTEFKGKLVFSAYIPDSGQELWVSDGTGPGTKMIKDIYPGPSGSGVISPVIIGDTLYFSADDGMGGELWRLINPDGQPEKFTNIPGGGAWGPELRRINKTFVFSASDVTHGTELWKMTDSGNTSAKDISPEDPQTLLYPNPVNDYFIVEIPDLFSLPAVISLYNISGERIMETEATNYSMTFNACKLRLSSGLYFMRVEDGRKSQTIKFLVL
jgi:ELWxxDGT repeat protein